MASEIANSTRTGFLSLTHNVVSAVVPSSIGQFCMALATISPLLAYPSLPHRNLISSIPEFDPASLLLNISRWQLFIHFCITLYSVGDVVNGSTADPISINTWPLYLSIFIHAASYPALSFSPDNPLRPSDFHLAGHWACYSLLYVLFRAFDIVLDRNPSYAFVLAALVVFPISEWLTKHVTKHTHAYMTRKISSPGWLCQARGADDFEPGWSFILGFALYLGHAILILVALVDAVGDR